MIERLFSSPVVTVEASPAMWTVPLHPEEEIEILRAGPKRRREFTAGRACAREAIARLGLPTGPIPVAHDRAPRWPSHVVGSISHCDDYCAAAVAPRGEIAGIGFDVERAIPLDDNLLAMVCDRDELGQAGRSSGLAAGIAVKILFSAKEAVYKCCYPLTRAFWEFQDVRVRLGERGAFVAYTPGGHALLGRYEITSDRVITGVMLSIDAAEAMRDSGAF